MCSIQFSIHHRTLVGRERRLDQRPVAAVLGPAHRQHAVRRAGFALLEVDGFGGRGEDLRVAVGGIARRPAEGREVRPIRIGQAVEACRSSSTPDRAVDGALVDRRLSRGARARSGRGPRV